MISYKRGDIFNSTMQTLVNPVNTVGVMGAGLAKQFAIKFPDMFEEYKAACVANEIKIGRLMLCRESSERWILNFPTKRHWRNKSQLHDIEEGLFILEEKYERFGITSIAVPKLGCGLGGLQWDDVNELFIFYLGYLDIPVEIYI